MSSWISAVVGGSIAVVGTTLVYWYFYSRDEPSDYRQTVVLRLLSGILMCAGITSQLVTNSIEHKAMVKGVSPTFLALVCLALILLEPMVMDLVNKSVNHNNHGVLLGILFFHYGALIGLIVWIFQYAAYTKDESAAIGLYIGGALYALMVAWILTYVYRITRDTRLYHRFRLFLFKDGYTGDDMDTEAVPFVDHPTVYPHDTLVENLSDFV